MGMTEQEKRESVIKEFKDNYRPYSPGYAHVLVRNWAIRDAIDLLKAQEPKVLSFAEAMLDTDRDVVWVEFRDDPIVEAVIPGFAVNEYADAYCAGFDSEDGTIRLSANQCGKIWRPWSLRPTDAQREAAKWE